MQRKKFLQGTTTLLAGGLIGGKQFHGRPSTRANIKPGRLKSGDTIGFIAPAGIVFDSNEYDRMEKVMEGMGLHVVFGEHVKERHGYLAGTDEVRASDLNRFFADSGIDGIITVRGGWGCNRLLPMVDFENIRTNPKFFCGFSDITSLHMSIYQATGLTTFHGPNGTSDWTIFTQNYFRKIAFGVGDKMFLENPVIEKNEIQTINSGITRGRLLGGNLTVITSLIGSRYIPDMKGAILFLEDIEEDVYRVDRMMSQLQLSGILNNINGFVFGRCSNCRESRPVSLTLKEVLDHYLNPLEVPAFYGSMISHEPNNFTIPIGVQAEMNADKGILQLLENPVI